MLHTCKSIVPFIRIPSNYNSSHRTDYQEHLPHHVSGYTGDIIDDQCVSSVAIGCGNDGRPNTAPEMARRL